MPAPQEGTHPVNPSLFRPEATPPAHHRPRTWSGTGAVAEPDLERAAAGARILLEALGVDLDSESLARTPERMAASLGELMSARPFHLTTFPNDGGYDELIVARGIPLRSLCEHQHAAVRRDRPHRLPPGHAHPRALEAGSSPGALRVAPAGSGEADGPGGRLVERPALTRRRRCGHRGRAPVHDPAGRAGSRDDDHHVEPARSPA